MASKGINRLKTDIKVNVCKKTIFLQKKRKILKNVNRLLLIADGKNDIDICERVLFKGTKAFG